MKKRLDANGMSFYRWMLRRPWTKPVNHVEVWEKIETKKVMKILVPVTRKVSVEDLTLTGRIEGKRDRGNQLNELVYIERRIGFFMTANIPKCCGVGWVGVQTTTITTTTNNCRHGRLTEN